MSVIADWTPEKGETFTKANLTFRHGLHERPMFDDAGLEELLDRYPREKLGVFTMGDDPVAWTSWRRGCAAGLSGSKLLEAAQSGRIWLNLRETNHHLPAYQRLATEIFAEKEAMAPGLRTFKRDLGMLISSANAQVFYHLDVPLVSLWQLRGQKRVWVYPVADPFVGAEALERIVLRESAEQFAFDPAWDAAAEVHDLTPGKMVTWMQNAPHRIDRIHDRRGADARQCDLRQWRAAPQAGGASQRPGRLRPRRRGQAGRGARGQSLEIAEGSGTRPARHIPPR
jgi:hypothetical protein